MGAPAEPRAAQPAAARPPRLPRIARTQAAELSSGGPVHQDTAGSPRDGHAQPRAAARVRVRGGERRRGGRRCLRQGRRPGIGIAPGGRRRWRGRWRGRWRRCGARAPPQPQHGQGRFAEAPAAASTTQAAGVMHPMYTPRVEAWLRFVRGAFVRRVWYVWLRGAWLEALRARPGCAICRAVRAVRAIVRSPFALRVSLEIAVPARSDGPHTSHTRGRAARKQIFECNLLC